MVLLVEDEGFTFEAAAAASKVAKSTCWEWVSLAAGERRGPPHAQLSGGPSVAAAREP